MKELVVLIVRAGNKSLTAINKGKGMSVLTEAAHLSPVLIGYVLLSLAVWRVSNKKSPATGFIWGCLLMLFGVFGPLFIHIFVLPNNKEEKDFFRDSFLIVASIGANIFASSVFNASPGQKLITPPDWVKSLFKKTTS